MGKNKNQRQPFWFFMQAKQEEFRKQGRNLSMAQLQQELGNLWAEMSEDQRAPYSRQSNSHRAGRPGSSSSQAGYGLLNTRGVPVQQELDEEMEIEDKEFAREELVKTMIEPLDLDELITKKFHIISFNVMVRTQAMEYYPIEIGLVQYTIKDGITKIFHCFPDPGPVPSGYMSETKRHCEATHKIPFMGFAKARGHNKYGEERRQVFSDLMMDIYTFFDDSGDSEDSDNLCLFVQNNDHMKMAEGCFKMMVNQTNEGDKPMYEDTFGRRLQLLSLPILLFRLAQKTGAQRPLAICEDDLTKSTYDYSPNTNCAFHDENENKYCSLGHCKKLCYMLSDVLCPAYKVEATSTHLPVSEDTSVTLTAELGQPWGWTENDGQTRGNRSTRYLSSNGEVQEDVRVIDQRQRQQQEQQQNNGFRPTSPRPRGARSRSPIVNNGGVRINMERFGQSSNGSVASSALSSSRAPSAATQFTGTSGASSGDPRLRPQPSPSEAWGSRDPRDPRNRTPTENTPGPPSISSSDSYDRRPLGFGRGRRPT